MVKRMSARDARNAFSDLLGSVYYTKEPVIVERQGRPFVVLISIDEYERTLRERQARFTVLDELHEANADVAAEEAMDDALREIVAHRAERASSSS